MHDKHSRATFLKLTLQLTALGMLSPMTNGLMAKSPSPKEDDILTRLITANDAQVERLLQAASSGKFGLERQIGSDFAALSASYCSTGSKYHQDASVADALEKMTALLISRQSEDGTLNFGNLESPPDTAFLLEPLSAGAFLLAKNASPGIVKVNGEIKKFILKSADALTVGGVHTPNHRFVISAALARLNALYPNKKYLDRIEEWMGEGIYLDVDGDFPERSKNYSNVEDNSLITLGRLLNKPALFEPVRKNLAMTYYYMDPNGDLVTTNSRRQDQYTGKSIMAFYLHYRYMAIRDNNGEFTSIAKLIENLDGFQEQFVRRGLVQFLENPLLQKELPSGTPLSKDYEKVFTNSQLLRIRRGDTTTTLFGGADWPIIIASGRSNSPNFYSYTKSKAILKYARLSVNFFSMGYFYSDGLKKDGKNYILHKKLTVPYYQPLPKNLRNAKGDYKLSPSIDGRFWNKMDFSNRPVSNVKTLDTTVSLLETNGANELTFRVIGPVGIQVTVELCFKEGGKLSGVTEPENGNTFLEKGMGKYEFGGDAIQFGPGANAHKVVTGLEGERYSTHFGTLRTDGMHVFITGLTPFNHKLTFS